MGLYPGTSHLIQAFKILLYMGYKDDTDERLVGETLVKRLACQAKICSSSHRRRRATYI
ncbi:unnamed protein product [Brassica oleracea]